MLFYDIRLLYWTFRYLFTGKLTHIAELGFRLFSLISGERKDFWLSRLWMRARIANMEGKIVGMFKGRIHRPEPALWTYVPKLTHTTLS